MLFVVSNILNLDPIGIYNSLIKNWYQTIEAVILSGIDRHTIKFYFFYNCHTIWMSNFKFIYPLFFLN